MDIYESRDEIRAHAIESAPCECCGLIIAAGKKQKLIRCRNASSTPRHAFMILPEDFRAAEDEGEIVAAYHSHYGTPAVPSEADKTVSEAHNLPFIIFAYPAETWDVYAPCGWRAKLEGRPFVHGVLDCYSLVRDYYDEVLGIKLDDFYREDDWWKPKKLADGSLGEPRNLYLDNYREQGFSRVSDLRIHDSILMQLESPEVPNHVGVYSAPGMMLHHPPGHLSGTHPYVSNWGFYSEATFGFYRHKSLK